MPVRSLDQVLGALDGIVADALDRRSRLGLFPALYLHMTRRVGQGLDHGRFEDPARMERLTATFAGRYLAALAAHRAGAPCPRSWRVAFAAAEDPGLICLQHLLLGMNAHINLDLAVAAVEVCPGDALPALRGDFDVISDLLAELLDAIQGAIDRVSPLFHVLDVLGGESDELLASFSVAEARRQAWRSADALNRLPAELQPLLIDALDQKTALLGRLLIRPAPVLHGALALIRSSEPDDAAVLIRAIQQAA